MLIIGDRTAASVSAFWCYWIKRCCRTSGSGRSAGCNGVTAIRSSPATVGNLINTVVRQPGVASMALVHERGTALYADDLLLCSALVLNGVS